MKLCTDCKYFIDASLQDPASPHYYRCRNPRLAAPEIVRHHTRRHSMAAAEVRDDTALCGPDAQWFEPKGE